MKTKLKIISLMLLPLVLMFFSACSDSTTDSGKTRLSPVTNLKAFSVNNTSVGLKWTKSVSENIADFDKYEIKIKRADTTVSTQYVNKGIDSVIISNLSNGVIYDFIVTAKVTSNSQNYIDSDPVQVRWSPAWRFTTEGTFPIQVYERTSSTGYASGLILYYFSLNVAPGPKTVSLLSADSSLIDIFVDSKGASNIALSSSHLYRPNRKITRFSTVEYSSETLNYPQFAPPDSATYTRFEITIDSVQVASSKIVYYKGSNGNYGRILIKRNPTNGTLIWGTSPEQYVRLEISYQSVPYNPYSKTSR
ncbi:MAG: hypothetical protein IGBAC_0757 [Ignavibacteriae bacterium]|nr:MAG: hypothetical protein IGBAC_0757 [Ignavibacteriota bacterium]